MIFQEPLTALNPLLTIGDQVAEVFRQHRNLDRRAALDEAAKTLQLVGLPPRKSPSAVCLMSFPAVSGNVLSLPWRLRSGQTADRR